MRCCRSGSSAALDGKLDLVAQFDGTGDSLAAIAGALTGQGNFGVSGLRIARFDPETFAAIAALDNLLEIEPEALTPLVAEALQQGRVRGASGGGEFYHCGRCAAEPEPRARDDRGAAVRGRQCEAWPT